MPVSYTHLDVYKRQDLADDHGHRISRKLHIQFRIKIIDRLDQADTADLEQVIRILIASSKPLYHAEHKA